MEWVAKPNAFPEEADRPRRPTPEEIERILSLLPRAGGIVREVGENAQKNIREWLRKELREVFLAPSAVPFFVRSLLSSYARARIAAGTPVGISVAYSVTSPMMQMTLNTFHTSGSSRTMSSGIEALKELLLARGKRRHESMTIYFADKHLTFAQVLEKRAALVGSTVADLLDSAEIFEVADLPRFWWHDLFPLVARKALPKSSSVLRLYFDVNELYVQRVSLADIAAVLETGLVPSVLAVYGPTNQGIMDLYPEPRIVRSSLRKPDVFLSDNVAERLYLNNFVRPDLVRLRVKGIGGLRRLFPVSFRVDRAILDEKPYASLNRRIPGVPEDSWVLFYNSTLLTIHGLGPEHVVLLCRAAGLEAVGQLPVKRDGDGAGRSPGLLCRGSGDRSPLRFIAAALERDRQADIEYEKEERKKGVRGIITREPTELQLAAEYVYAETENAQSANPVAVLKETLASPLVDSTLTFSNNVHAVNELLGVEAARSLLVKELYETISDTGSYIDPRHLGLVADVITGRGLPLGITYSGISRQPGGPISLATVERAGEVFTKAGIYGKTENIESVSASIATGQKIVIGTGSFELPIDERRLAELNELADALPQVSSPLREATTDIQALDDIFGGLEPQDFNYGDDVAPSNVFDIGELIPQYVGKKEPVALGHTPHGAQTGRQDAEVDPDLLAALRLLSPPPPAPAVPPPRRRPAPAAGGLPPALLSVLSATPAAKIPAPAAVTGLPSLPAALLRPEPRPTGERRVEQTGTGALGALTRP